jgi:hypothetical protein
MHKTRLEKLFFIFLLLWEYKIVNANVILNF